MLPWKALPLQCFILSLAARFKFAMNCDSISMTDMVLTVSSCYRGRNGLQDPQPVDTPMSSSLARAYWGHLATLATSPSCPGPMPTCIILRLPVGSGGICSDTENAATEGPFLLI